MNEKMHRYILGRVLLIEGALLLVPLFISLIFREGSRIFIAYLLSAAITALSGLLLCYKKPEITKLYTRDGLIIVTLIWFNFSFFGALPFVFSGDIPYFWDAFFETVSGFTTTGASILQAASTISKAGIFWKSFTHLIGGMGVLVFALAIFPGLGADSQHIMKAEVPGPTFGKLNSRIKDTAKRLYKIYLVMTGCLVLILIMAGMNVFDALIHAMSTAGTGGFSSQDLSIAYYNNPLIEIILTVGMLLFAINFNLYHYLLVSKGKERLRSEELHWFLGIVLAVTLLMAVNIAPQYHTEGQPLLLAFKDSFFTTSSIISTTGFATADFNCWPVFSKYLILLLMCFGGMAGSTAGGLKTSRVAMLIKSAIQGIKSSRDPKRAVPLRFEFKMVANDELLKLFHYFLVYVLFFTGAILLISLDQFNFSESFSAVASCFNNVGPGLGRLGPRGSYIDFSPFSKIVLSICMIAGRLEIYPVLMLLHTPSFKREKYRKIRK